MSFDDSSKPGARERVEKKIVTVDAKPAASVARSSVPPKVSSHGWAEKDAAPLTNGPLLVHVIVRNESPLPQTLAIRRREIHCREPGDAAWSLLLDVPQGLSLGPAVAPGNGWVGFVSVVERPASPKSEEPCVASFDMAWERTPTGYAVLETLEVPLREDSGWGLGSGDVEWPLD